MARRTKNGGPSEKQQRNPEQPLQQQHDTGDWEDSPETMNIEPPPPQYDEEIMDGSLRQDNAQVQAKVTGDGRITIDFERRSSLFSSSIASQIQNQIREATAEKSQQAPPTYGQEGLQAVSSSQKRLLPPSLNIVIQIVGSRGDIQPFIALGTVLRNKYAHRVRIATHPIFQSFVESNGLEFFSIGGDPAELMAFMVRSPGLLPSLDALRGGDVARHRKTILQMMEGCWRACVEEGDGMGEDRLGEGSGKERKSERSFVADVIIANPPSFAHIHCAQKLGVPVHLMFTMPWSATQAFPHPLANIKPTNADVGLINYISYAMVETIFWQGLGSVMNRFREKTLGLEPARLAFGPRIASRLKIPYTYCWSPSLIPKPRDWGSHISVAGFYFLPLADGYTPDTALSAFLASGPPPIYIGFGSIVVDNPEAVTRTIFEAIRRTGVRALVSRGWGGLGSLQPPENVLLIGDVPHDWLFPRVSCVVHHGGAGTTAAAIAVGKPNVIVPFFGDQPFWGSMIWNAGVGPKPVPGRELTDRQLAIAIEQALQPVVIERAKELGRIISNEKGTEAGAMCLHQQVDVQCTNCALTPYRVAVWRVRKTDMRLSAFAATVLLNAGLLRVENLKLHRHQEYDLESGPWDPITGVVSACLGMVGNMSKSLGDVPSEVSRARKSNPSGGSSVRESMNIAQGTVVGTSKGIGRILAAGFKSPFEVTLAAARGFRNVPALYGDETVRPVERITGIKSGLGTAGKELGYSLYDGVSGLFMQPINGAKQEGLVGFGKGLGKGIGGIIFKPVSAVWGVAGYTYEGVNKEMEKLFGSSIKSHIALARLAQGSEEFAHASDEEIAELLQRWEDSQAKAP